jgi:uncharacterized protein
MFDRLPDWFDPPRLASQAREIKGFLPLAEMPRLSAVLADSGGRAAARFLFTRAAGLPARLTGHVEAVLRVQCQRCLEPMDLPVSHAIDARLVSEGTEAEAIPDHEDAVWVEARGLSLHTLVEDELLLSLPVVALHGRGSTCAEAALREFAQADVIRAQREDDSNPFAILQTLKEEGGKDR